MIRHRLIAALLLAAAPFAAPSAQAAQQEAPAPSAQAQVPLSRVLRELAQRYPGKQLNTTMGQVGGRPAYVVQWQLTNGHVVVFTVDAQTGQVVG